MSKTQLIAGPAGNIEVEAFWQTEETLASKADNAHCHGDVVALICHPHPLFDGTMNNKVVTTMFRFARDEGMHAVRFNFRGVGKSEGEHDYAKGEVEDALAVLQWIATQTTARKLWIGGFSFGGYVAARVAEQVFVSPHIWGLSDFEIMNVALISPSIEKNDGSDLTLPTNKTFEIYGDEDNVIKPESMHAFAEQMQISSSVIPGAGHLFHGFLGDIKNLLTKYTFEK